MKAATMNDRTVQHQFLPHPQTVKFSMDAVIRPDKADFMLSVTAEAVKGGPALWDYHRYVPRTPQGIQSILNELLDCLTHMEDFINVNVPTIEWEDLNETEF